MTPPHPCHKGEQRQHLKDKVSGVGPIGIVSITAWMSVLFKSLYCAQVETC